LLPAGYNASVFLDDGSLVAKQDGTELAVSELGLEVREVKHQRARGGGKRGTSMGAKFRNFRRETLTMHWDDGTPEGVYSGEVRGLGRTATLTYDGHAFAFRHGDEEVARFVMDSKQHMYIIEPVDDETRASEAYAEAKREAEFMREYADRTGYPWLAFYPRDKPVLNMWPADAVGQTHVVSTPHAHLDASGPVAAEMAFRLTALSHAPAGPRVFLIPELLSAFECRTIVELGTAVVRQSMVGQGGGFQSKTRTSRNGWLKRSSSPLLDHVYKRFGHVLGIDHTLLGPNKNAEELQVVRYDQSQEYAPHHDFSDDGTPEQRFLTLLLYIQLPDAGGATSFPKAFDGRGLQLVPNAGDAILFYNMLPDGNGDDLALHAGMPVKAGQKWVCNLWVWDPHR